MSFNNIKTKLRQERGFTIVELLIVIVVIGILAAITIVSFNGVTAKANTANAQSAAETVVKKVEAYNAENAGYPATFSLVTAAGNSANSSYIASGTYTLATAVIGSAPSTSPATISIQKCITGSAITGMIVGYWNFSTGIAAYLPTGTTAGATCTYIAS